MKKGSFFVFTFLFLLFFPPFSFAFDFEKGKFFQFESPEGDLVLTLESEKEIGVLGKVFSEFFYFDFQKGEGTSKIKLSGLKPNTSFYKYEDTHQNFEVVVSNEKGEILWQQDLENSHFVWFQKEKGTVFLPSGCQNFGTWDSSTRTCTLNSDIQETIEIQDDNLTLDCQGRKILGKDGSGFGIFIRGRRNITIKNCQISNFGGGIIVRGYYETNSEKIKIENNLISHNKGSAIEISNLREGSVVSNEITSNSGGIFGVLSKKVFISENNIFQNGRGISLLAVSDLHLSKNLISQISSTAFYVWNSENLVLSQNQFRDNYLNFELFGSKDSHFNHQIDTTNTIDGKPIFYLKEEKNKIFDEKISMSVFYCIFCENITLKNLEFTKNSIGILFWKGKNFKIEKNRIFKNPLFGIFLGFTESVIIAENEFFDNGSWGSGIVGDTRYVSSGLCLRETKDTLILRNNFSNERFYLEGASFTKIYHNNFFNFRHFLPTLTHVVGGSFNQFDNGPISGGNFWSDYRGRDENGDGIGETSYSFRGGEDRYPFVRKDGWIKENKILISEVYYDVAKDKGKEGDNEWVILRNLENKPVDLTGWQVCDNEKCDSFPSAQLPPFGLAIVTPTSTTFNYWKIPKNMTRIVLLSKFGSHGLSNDGDRVILKDKNGKIIDAMSYGNDNSVFNPPCPKVKEGRSLLRFPPDVDTDTCQDFIEANPTIGENQAPIPFISYFPKYPIKGTKVNFDASLSDDPDGTIVSFVWEIKKVLTSETLATTSGTTTDFLFSENGEYEIILLATDENGATSSTSTILKIQPFSFAIITDLHIGRHYKEEYQGEDYYLTERLKNVVNWINQNKEKIRCENEICPLRFLAILGDITDNTSLSGFCKAKEILDNLEIPYVVVFGNHDVGPDKEYEKLSRWKGQDYFDQVFWSTTSIPCQNAPSSKNFETLLREFNFQRDEENKDYKNFAFNCGGINFIGLDFVSREKFMKRGPGVGPDGVLNFSTEAWLTKKIEELGKSPTILFAHHPIKKDFINGFTENEIKNIIEILDKGNVILGFGGHIHSFEEIHGHGKGIANMNKMYSVIEEIKIFTTEALMVGSNGRGIKDMGVENGVVGSKKGIVRIVKIFENAIVHPNNWETTETNDEFLAFNPYFNFGFSLKRYLGRPCIELEAKSFCDKTIKPYTIIWDFGDGEIKEGVKVYTKCYAEEGKFKITLTLKDINSNFTESLSKQIEIKEGMIVKTITRTQRQIEENIRFFSEKSQMFFDKIGEVGGQIKTWILQEKSELIPIGIVSIDFDRIKENFELPNLVVKASPEKGKFLLYMEEWPEQVERFKVMFVRKNEN